jgi:hypothetical protein
VDSISLNFLNSVLEVVVDEEREVNVAALNLLRVVAFNSMAVCDELVERYAILDFLYTRLLIENGLPAN